MSTNAPDASTLPPGLQADPCTREAELAAYDSLPPTVRRAIQDAPLSLSAISVREAFEAFVSERFLVEAISKRSWETIRDYPMLPNYPRLEPSFPPTGAKARKLHTT
jgi:hypothetical protein